MKWTGRTNIILLAYKLSKPDYDIVDPVSKLKSHCI